MQIPTLFFCPVMVVSEDLILLHTNFELRRIKTRLNYGHRKSEKKISKLNTIQRESSFYHGLDITA